MVKNKKVYNFVIVPLVIIVAAFIRMVCVQVFTLPYNFAPGGATGIATMIEYKTGFQSGWTILIVNAPLLIFAFFYISKGFALKTGASIALSSVGMVLMNQFNFPVPEIAEPVLAAIACGVLGGVALAMMLKIGGSTGGSDIVAVAIQRKFSAAHVSWFIYAIDATVVFSSAFVYTDRGLTPILMSLTQMFCSSMMSDVIGSGFKSALKFEIITKEPEKLGKELIEKLGRGVTCIPVRGMYSNDERAMLICVIRKRQLSEFNAILKMYPDTFAYVTNTSEVMGLGFSR